MAGRGDTVAAHNLDGGACQNLEVERQSDVVDIPDVEGELLLPGEGVSAVDLAPAGDARGDLVTPRLLWRVPVEIADEERSRPDEAHVAAEHVPELGQFIEAEAADDLADAGEAVLVGEQGAGTVAFVGHRAELGDLEGSAAEAGAGLAE